eukprot:1463534-Pyramimonas_sp.AAC.1
MVARETIGGESNSSAVRWLIKGSTDRSHVWHFRDIREHFVGEELSSAVVKGLMKDATCSVWSPKERCGARQRSD